MQRVHAVIPIAALLFLHSDLAPCFLSTPPQVVPVAEGYGTADALRAVASRITSRTFVVLSGDLLTDVPVGALVAQHNLHAGAMATMLLADRKVSPASETKPGKPPKVRLRRGCRPCCGCGVLWSASRLHRGGRRAAAGFAACHARIVRMHRTVTVCPSHRHGAATSTTMTTTATVLAHHPQNVDYIGLDPSRQHLLFYASRPDALRDLKVGPKGAVEHCRLRLWVRCYGVTCMPTRSAGPQGGVEAFLYIAVACVYG